MDRLPWCVSCRLLSTTGGPGDSPRRSAADAALGGWPRASGGAVEPGEVDALRLLEAVDAGRLLQRLADLVEALEQLAAMRRVGIERDRLVARRAVDLLGIEVDREGRVGRPGG